MERRCVARGVLREHILGLGAFPIEMGWCVGEALLLPFLLQLKVPMAVASLFVIINPIAGLFLQAPFGSCSDQCASEWGKRKPFLLLFTVTASIGMLVIIKSPIAATVLSSFTGMKMSHNNLAAIFLFLGFGLMDVSHDLLLTPTRAMLNDSANSEEDLGRINIMYTTYALSGRLFGFAVCTFLPRSIRLFLGGNQFFASLWVCMGFLLLIMGIILAFCQEKRQYLSSVGSIRRVQQYQSLSWNELPAKFVILWILQLGGWLVINSFCFFFTSYCVLCVFDGQNFAYGTRFATLGFILQALVSLVVNWLLPAVNRRLGLEVTYCLAEISGCLSLAFMAIFRDETSTLILISLCGIIYPVHSSNAFIILETLPEMKIERNRGLLNGYLNNSMVVAQILTGLLGAAQNFYSNKFDHSVMSCEALSQIATTVLIVDICLIILYGQWFWPLPFKGKKELPGMGNHGIDESSSLNDDELVNRYHSTDSFDFHTPRDVQDPVMN